MFQNIIFDWSGVINDNAYSIYQTHMDIFRSFNAKEISFEEFKKEWMAPYMKFYNKFLPEVTREQQEEGYKKAIVKFDQNKPYEGIPELLKKLSDKKIKMFIVSSDYPETLFGQIKDFGLNDFFTEVFHSLHEKKEASKTIIDKYNLNPENTIIIGDTNHEIEVGKEVGIKTCAVTWGTAIEENLKKFNPDFIAHDLAELEGILLK
jgi:HAD superfamily hydrolase (TIGR01509 family)